MAAGDFDVAVVGGGSAGCIVAGRLTESGVRVCLVEAGPDYGPRTGGRWPPELLEPRQRPRTHDWGYDEQPLARVIGGCSTHNQCAAVWGQPEDYEAWAKLGNPGWRPAEIRPLMDRIDRGLSANPYTELAFWQRAFLDTAVAAGFKHLNNVGAPGSEEGVAPFHANVKDGFRWNAAFAFLDPVRDRRNLAIADRTLVDRVQIDVGKASALVCRRGRESFELRAHRFVLAAGAFGSPAILLRSGVGPAEYLRKLRIPVRLDRQGVGRNLHDHPGVGVAVELSAEAERAILQDRSNSRFYQSQVILRAQSPSVSAGFDLHILPSQSIDGFSVTSSILAFHLAPRSRGTLRLRSRDPRREPVADFRFLSDDEGRDEAVLLAGLSLARSLIGRKPLGAAVRAEVQPGRRIRAERSLRGYVHQTVAGYSHPVGTCRMGPASDPAAVVDAYGKVHGLDNVFVADASIMPQIPRANTNLTCMLIGLRVAEGLLSPMGR